MKTSIIMPTYNDATHIASSIQSVIDQTYTDWELLIMDDGSKDNTEEVVRTFNDSRIFYFRQENKGQLVALNNLCPYVTGDFVLMLHSDDSLFCADTIEVNLKYFEDPEVDGLFSDFHQFFDSGKPDEIVAAPKRMDKSAVKKLLTLLGSNIIFDHFFVRRNKFEVNVRYNYFKYYMPYWLKFSSNDVSCLNLKYTPYPWYHYRVYDQNYTNSVIGNFEVYFTRFRSIFFLSDYLTVPFPLIQKEVYRRYKILLPVLERKAGNKHLARCYEANVRSMKSRTKNAYTKYFEKLISFYKADSKKIIRFAEKIEIYYTPADARKFYNDLNNDTLPVLVSEIIRNMPKGFMRVDVDTIEDKEKLEELFRFLCIRANVVVLSN
ncbi:MAG: glycosyltransferase [Paludibacter sp.]|nr:glycosyltransferase [Paludibacter sp.]